MRLLVALDEPEWPHCFGPTKILVALLPADAAGEILGCVDLPARPQLAALARLCSTPLRSGVRNRENAARREGCAGLRTRSFRLGRGPLSRRRRDLRQSKGAR